MISNSAHTVPDKREQFEEVLTVSSAAALGGFLFGYDSAVINGAGGAIGRTFFAAPATLGLSVASALLGAAAGSPITGRVADRQGRLFPMRLAAILFIISAIGCGLSQSLLLVSIFRFVGGIAIGVASVIAPAYIAEIAPAKSRGKCGSLQQLAIVTGIFISLLVDYAIAAAAGGAESTWVGVQYGGRPRGNAALRNALVIDLSTTLSF